MTNALTLFDQAKPAVPEHIAGFMEQESNIEDRITVPSLSYEGKVWTIAMNGERTKLVKRDDEGDEVPVAIMRLVILDYAKRRGRSYYEGAYDPANASAPICWSDDGVEPHASVPADKKQCGTCAACPMAVKGSKVSEQGKEITACSQHRMVAVVPATKLDMTPLRLKLAITSDWDKQSPELEAQGWYAFSNYTDFLRSKGVQHTAALVTKLRFDPNVAYPKVMFTPDRWLTEAELAQVAPITKTDDVQKLITGSWTSAGVDGTSTDQSKASAADESAERSKDMAAAAEVEAQAKKEAEEKAEAERAAKAKAAAEKAAETRAANKAKKEAEEKAKAEAAAKPASGGLSMIMDDDDDEVPEALKTVSDGGTTGTSATSDTPATSSDDVPADVAALLSDWEDD